MSECLENASVVLFLFHLFKLTLFYMNFYGNLAIDKYCRVFNIDPEEVVFAIVSV